jgi:GAG-pre-integrase domain
MQIDGAAGTYHDQYSDGYDSSRSFSNFMADTLTDLLLVKSDVSSDFSVPIAHVHNCPVSDCPECNGRPAKKSAKSLWILDSGASKHFTFALSDFLEYTVLKHPIKVTTAANPIFIIGEGTVLLEHYVLNKGIKQPCITRLYPVYYLPNITSRLLSLGDFLQQGILCYGSSKQITLVTKNARTPLMQCVPHKIGDTIYWLEMCTSNKHGHFAMPTTIYKVDYDLMHKRMGHPSMDVLRKAKDHTKGFPNDITYPEETPLCRGCAQGKMPSASFPSSQTRASRPFEKVHSDVKSFPVALYHKA